MTTVVFVHGFMDNASLWNNIRLPLAARAVNLRHVDVAAGRGAILAGYRDQVLAVIDGPTVVVGHSMGAQIAELVAVARPEAVLGIALLTAIPLAGYPLSPEQAAVFEQGARSRDAEVAAEGRRALLVNSAGALEALVTATLATPPEMALQELEAWTTGHPLGDEPSKVDVPVLLIGSEDTFTSVDTVAPRFTDVRTARVAGAGHWPHVEQPAAMAGILTDFIEELGK
ncbi:alpha/beta hydrolase [Kutzneria sp. NPDC051319]|uniref:alpha/beta fold hydrolase n=1 Tax=Kutzneria sp. NPDC051319 TaxID=3155047 RepID=UPI003446876B